MLQHTVYLQYNKQQETSLLLSIKIKNSAALSKHCKSSIEEEPAESAVITSSQRLAQYAAVHFKNLFYKSLEIRAASKRIQMVGTEEYGRDRGNNK